MIQSLKKKENIIGLIVNIVFFVLLSIANYNYFTVNINEYITKSCASALFVLCGMFNLFYWLGYKKCVNLRYSVVLVLALVMACAGDILLIYSMIYGALVFALGHVLFIVAFSFVEKFRLMDFLIGGGIFVACVLLIILYPFDFEGMTALILVYAFVISLMLGKAISNCLVKDSKYSLLVRVVVAIGAFLFFFSDLMLVFRWFGGASVVFSYLCMGTYYPANWMLAFSVFLISALALKKEKRLN